MLGISAAQVGLVFGIGEFLGYFLRLLASVLYGLALLIGSALMGWLYDLSQTGIIIAFTCVVEAIAVFLYMKMIHAVKRDAQANL